MADTTVKEIITIVVTVLACGGFWTFVQSLINRHDNKKLAMDELKDGLKRLQESADKNATSMDLQNEALMSLAQDRILWLGKEYIKQGWIYIDDYKSIRRMALAYRELGGNDLVKIIMDEVDKLPRKLEDKKK